jgi:GntR family transcriptional repressor for pyruvate dehydrogenase complex
MQSLNLLGVVDISPRRGTKIRALPVESVVDLAILSGVMGQQHAIADVFEFRDAMESAIAELSARNASDTQIESIRQILEANAAAVRRGDGAEAHRIDVRFHAKIADACGNLVFIAVASALNGLLSELRRVMGVIYGASEAAFAEHQEIFAAIARRDGPAARRATARHIRNSQARYESARLSQARDGQSVKGSLRGPAARTRRIVSPRPLRKRRGLA